MFSIINRIGNKNPVPSTAADLPKAEEYPGPNAETEMTAAEIQVAKINISLLRMALFLDGSEAVPSEDADACWTRVEEWLLEFEMKHLSMNPVTVSPFSAGTAICLHRDTPTAPSWRYLHESFLILESVKAASLFASVAAKKNPKAGNFSKERANRLKSSAHQIYEGIRDNARTLKLRVSTSGMLTDLIQHALGGCIAGEGGELQAELEKTIDMSDMEVFCGSLMESWEEALEGVLQVKL